MVFKVNLFLFIEYMSLYEFLVVSLLSMAILEFKLWKRLLFPPHCGEIYRKVSEFLQREGITNNIRK